MIHNLKTGIERKIAVITGITGQDGPYLAKVLIENGYKEVIGVVRPNSIPDIFGLEYLGIRDRVKIVGCDLEKYNSVLEFIEANQPHEIYNLAAQSSVGLSFQKPNHTFYFNTISVINLLEAIKTINKKIRFYQASSSEMFGNVSYSSLPIKETLSFHPVSPYGISKASAHWLTVNYREAFGLFTSCGILFNHESALRGDNFVIKKIINTAVNISRNKADVLTLGNLAISRDWGYAPLYVEAMWRMLQMEKPDDYIVCSGSVSTLQDIVIGVFNYLNLDLEKSLRLSPNLMRSLDLSIIYGDNSKARRILQWNYELTINELLVRLIKDEIDLINYKEMKVK